MPDRDELERRVRDLEDENRRLRSRGGGGSSPPKEITTHVSLFKGRPVITFDGPFRPFSFGLRKATVILQRIQDVQFFVDNNQHFLASGEDTE